MLSSGSEAPDFTAIAHDGRSFRLSEALRSGPLILYFYPADFTPGCTREACALRDMHDDLKSTGLRVVGVSPQSAESHRRFRERYALPFTLLADPDKAVIQQYGADGPLGMGVRRISYLIDRDGRIAAAIEANFKVSDHVSFFQQAIEKNRQTS